MGPLQSFYASPAHHPFLLWFLLAAFLGKLLSTGMVRFRRKLKRGSTPLFLGPDSPWLARFLAAFCVVGILDVWLTASNVLFLGSLEGSAARIIPFLFVVAGDWRVFWFLFRRQKVLTPSRASKSRPMLTRIPPWAKALTLAWVVPLLCEATLRSSTLRAQFAWIQTGRGMFLTYELLFLIVATLLWLALFKKDRVSSRVLVFVIGYYALWSAGDALILMRNPLGEAQAVTDAIDWEWAPRLLANLLYYGGLLPWIYYVLSRSQKEPNEPR